MKGFRVRRKLEELKRQGRKAFIPYIMAGDPNLEETKRRLKILEDSGADLIELGVPFTDPLADGPVIQRASERALKAGTTLRGILSFLRENRGEFSVPIILMTYLNPVFRYGVEEFFRDAKEAEVSGVIFPDLTVEESKEYRRVALKEGIDTVFLVAPTSTRDRIMKIAKVSTGFVYYVSITGITGSALRLDKEFESHISFVRSLGKPVCLGFGVSTPEESSFVARYADGVIVGSAIVKAFEESPEGVAEFLKNLREAI